MKTTHQNFMAIIMRMSIYFIFLVYFVQNSQAYPPAVPVTHKPSICNYCLCDEHSSTVICTSSHMLLKTVNLPKWAETFYAHNLTMAHLPHFSYHLGLKILRINYCKLSDIHPLALIPLPNLETVHLADNLLNSIPETLFRRLTRLRILNMARNKIENIDELEWAFPEGLVLDQLVLDGNPIKMGANGNTNWPMAKQLHMADANIESFQEDKIIFKPSTLCPDDLHPDCRTLKLNSSIWTPMKVLDLSGNINMSLNTSTLQKLVNITNLKLNEIKLPDNFFEWLPTTTSLRHLELRNVTLHSGPIKSWRICSLSLEWLDLSDIGLEELEIKENCKVKWLYASENRIQKLRLRAKSLRTIYLDDNQLYEWPFEDSNSQFPNLEVLSIRRNSIEELPAKALHRFPALENLDLSGNLIDEIHETAFPTIGISLQYLNLSQNRLREFKNHILPSLMVLDLSRNQLHGMDGKLLNGLPSLQHFHLAHNFAILRSCENVSQTCWLEEARDLLNLLEIDLSGCQIKKQPDLAMFPNLRSVNLAENFIPQIDGRQLPACVGHLNLRWNRVHSLDNFTDGQLECLKDLDLGHNPLKCDCSLMYFAEILSFQTDLSNHDVYYCFTELLHPLGMYLETNESCDEAYGNRSIVPVIMNIITITLTIATVGVLMFMFFIRVRRAFDIGAAQFLYRPVPTEMPTAL